MGGVRACREWPDHESLKMVLERYTCDSNMNMEGIVCALFTELTESCPNHWWQAVQRHRVCFLTM